MISYLFKIIKTTSITLVALATFNTSANQPSDIEISANIALATEYVFRGIVQTQGEPAVSGGFDLTHSSGFYLGVWSSNVNFSDTAPENLELDIYGGWSSDITDDLSVNLGLIGYTYSGDDTASAANLSEIVLGLAYRGFDATYYIGNGDADDYFEFNYGYDWQKISFSATYGYADFDESYYFYGLGATTQLQGLDISLNWIDNNQAIDDSNIVLSVSKTF